ncbi:MAG: DNA polymerase III subunit beta [Anaerolineae bacterium]|nr:DNA polymerase III subunit beta [Anaerolineae bacterium]
MKLSCLQENLARGLSIVGRAVPSRTTMPILSNVLLATDNGQLKLAATNLELSVVHWVGARVETDGAITVPARNFIDLMNSLPPDQVALSLDPQTLSLDVRCGMVSATFRGISSEEFPLVPEAEDNNGVSVEEAELRQGLEQVTFAASTDDSHPVLTGILVEFEGNVMTMAAADGFRLSVRKIPLLQPVAHPFNVIVPARALLELQRILGGQEEPVHIFTTNRHNQIVFRLEDTVLNSRLIDGNFPDYRRIIPQSHQTRAVIGRQEWLQACKRAAIFARDVANIVRLEIGDDGEVVVSAVSAESGEGATRLAASVEGPKLEIAFNVRFLIDVLSALDVPQVSLSVNAATNPGVLRAVGDESAFTHVVMPMHLGQR